MTCAFMDLVKTIHFAGLGTPARCVVPQSGLKYWFHEAWFMDSYCLIHVWSAGSPCLYAFRLDQDGCDCLVICYAWYSYSECYGPQRGTNWQHEVTMKWKDDGYVYGFDRDAFQDESYIRYAAQNF